MSQPDEFNAIVEANYSSEERDFWERLANKSVELIYAQKENARLRAKYRAKYGRADEDEGHA